MKKILFLALSVLTLSTTSNAQSTITFKEENLVIPGTSAGKLKGLDYNPSEYETFYAIDKKKKTLTFSTLQTFGLEENTANNLDYEQFTIQFSDITTEYFPETPILEESTFATPHYVIDITCKNFGECIDFSYNYRFSPTRELIKGTNNLSMKVCFTSESEALSFIQTMRKLLKL